MPKLESGAESAEYRKLDVVGKIYDGVEVGKI